MKKILLFIPLLFLCFSFNSSAEGDLLIFPMRVVFEGNKQKESISLVNSGKDTAVYSISFVQRSMKEDGSFVAIEKPDSGQMFAEPYLRIFPRTVTLAPGEPQVIVLQFRRKPDMAAGEYRSHLYFRSEKKTKPLGNEEPADANVLSFNIIPIYGISIPVIIRTGEVNVSSTISGLKLETAQDTIHTLKLTINRAGNISLYGNLTVEYIPAQGKPFVVGALNGVGVYTTINKRYVDVKLNKMPAGTTLKNGKLKVSYTSAGDTKKVVYAEGELVIN